MPITSHRSVIGKLLCDPDSPEPQLVVLTFGAHCMHKHIYKPLPVEQGIAGSVLFESRCASQFNPEWVNVRLDPKKSRRNQCILDEFQRQLAAMDHRRAPFIGTTKA
jgi:hypothetical protein